MSGEVGDARKRLAEESRFARPLCELCGPGYRIGDPGCRHAAPEPVAAAPDDTEHANAEAWFHYQFTQNATCAHWIGGAQCTRWADALLAAGYLSPAEVARVKAEAKADALAPIHALADEWEAKFNDWYRECVCHDGLRAALVGGPDNQDPK